MQETLEKISETLYGEDEIVCWAKQRMAAESEWAEIRLELKKKLAVRGTLGALGILGYLLYLGFKQWLHNGGLA